MSPEEIHLLECAAVAADEELRFHPVEIAAVTGMDEMRILRGLRRINEQTAVSGEGFFLEEAIAELQTRSIYRFSRRHKRDVVIESMRIRAPGQKPPRSQLLRLYHRKIAEHLETNAPEAGGRMPGTQVAVSACGTWRLARL